MFQGRNVTNVAKMITHVREYNQNASDRGSVTISVEIEKAKPELASLIPLADVVFVSKDYALFQGYSNMKETIEKVRNQAIPG